MSTTLVTNIGGSSRKYALYKDGQSVMEFNFEGTDSGFEMCTHKKGSQQTCESISSTDTKVTFAIVARAVHLYLEAENETLSSIGVRILAPGAEFQKHTVIDDVYVSALQARSAAAPLHVPETIREITEIKKVFPKVKLVGVSDTFFHKTLPHHAREYSISPADAAVYDIHRFGCHGLSVASVVHRVHAVTGGDPTRLVICHIGSGVSVTAVKEGKSVDTTAGFAPVSGVVMSTRASDLDPSAFLELMRRRNMHLDEASVYVHETGGLAGLAGDGDIRRLLSRKAQGDEKAKQALTLFSYQIQKAIAAMTIALGGLDAVVFTGTASFRSSELRALCTDKLSHFGIGIDTERNDVLVGREGVISVAQSMVKVAVMRTDEMGEIARIAEQITPSS